MKVGSDPDSMYAFASSRPSRSSRSSASSADKIDLNGWGVADLKNTKSGQSGIRIAFEAPQKRKKMILDVILVDEGPELRVHETPAAPVSVQELRKRVLTLDI